MPISKNQGKLLSIELITKTRVMKMYHCKLVHKNSIVESFFREGTSIEGVLKELLQLQWPEGKWTVVDNDDEFVDFDDE